jgi:hypothetical protein
MSETRERSNQKPYSRLLASVYFTEVGLHFLRRKPRRPDDELGGVRVYSDEAPREGARLHVEIFLPDHTSVICKVDVAWVDPLPAGSPARYDLGLTFVAIHPQDRERLAAVLQAP